MKLKPRGRKREDVLTCGASLQKKGGERTLNTRIVARKGEWGVTVGLNQVQKGKAKETCEEKD